MQSTSSRPQHQNVQSTATSAISKHPRRQPAQLSASLRHDNPSSSGRYLSKQPAKERHHARDSDLNVQKWFDQSNKHPEEPSVAFLETEPPYFLPYNSSNTSNNDSSAHHHAQHSMQRLDMQKTATSGSSADDYRSVIDDLTIENKKLKEKLRRYEKLSNAHLEKDKLFEVKIHALPSRKRRELENTLQAFASSLDDSTDDSKSKISLGGAIYPALRPIAISGSKLSASSSTSNSRLVDSAYASTSNSGQHLSSKLNYVGTGDKKSPFTQVGEEQKIQNYLHNIPHGLLHNHAADLTEGQKKRIVVQRLEQLFTGKQGAIVGKDSHPLQQQEVSESAARADRALDSSYMSSEGHREAYMRPQISGDEHRPGKLLKEASAETQFSRDNTDSSNESSPDRSSPEQRPTRPMDLDPDRAQVPSDNVDYIRHLGLSTPQLVSDDPADLTADADGWLFLNLLVNMAQLHIINVTADFVRAAVLEVSQKFQLSRDGNKVRWRGGHRETQFSGSDSGASSAIQHESVSTDDARCRKRQKRHSGRFQSVPMDLQALKTVGTRSKSSAFHYKPLFHHQDSSSEQHSTDESEVHYSRNQTRASTIARSIGAQHTSHNGQNPESRRKRRHDGGPIAFYSGAKFCTDLSGDREGIVTPLHVFGIGKDGYSNHTEDALGCEQRPSRPYLPRTDSGSLLPFRPFRDYSQGPAFLEIRPNTPEPLRSDFEEGHFVNHLPMKSQYTHPLQNFEASGLGGIQPADHFALQVETLRTIPIHSSLTKTKLSKFSAPGLNSRKICHIISKASLKRFREEQSVEEVLTTRLAALGTFSPPTSPLRPATTVFDQLPVQTEILSTKTIKLQPSQLPPPIGYYTTYSTSEYTESLTSSECSSVGISALRHDRSYLYPPARVSDEGDDEDDEYMDEIKESESSIDMLAQVRELDPVGVVKMEMEIDEEVRQVAMENGEGVSSSVATVDEESPMESEVDGESSMSE